VSKELCRPVGEDAGEGGAERNKER